MALLRSILFACILVLVNSLEQPLEQDGKATSFIISDEHEIDSAHSSSRICAAHGDYVRVTIRTAPKYLEVLSYMSSHQIGSVWTAGDDLLQRNVYEWNVDTNGKRVPFEYVNWLDGAPLLDESCRCVAFVSGGHSSCGNQTTCAGMTVEPCHLKRRVLCEYVKNDCEK